jgi:hypothetical protein
MQSEIVLEIQQLTALMSIDFKQYVWGLPAFDFDTGKTIHDYDHMALGFPFLDVY